MGEGEGEGVGQWEETSAQRILCRLVRYVSVLEVRVTVQRAERGLAVGGWGLRVCRREGRRAGTRVRPGEGRPAAAPRVQRTRIPRGITSYSIPHLDGSGHSSFVRRYAQPLSMAYLLPVLPRLLLILPCHRHPRTHGARDVAASVSGDLGALSHPPVFRLHKGAWLSYEESASEKAPCGGKSDGPLSLGCCLGKETRATMARPIAHSPRPVVTAMRDDLLRWALGAGYSTFDVSGLPRQPLDLPQLRPNRCSLPAAC